MDHIPKSLKLVETNLKKIIRAIFRKPKFDKKSKSYTETTPLYKKLKVLKLQDLYYYNLALLVHDYFYNTALPITIHEKFDKTILTKQYKTRSDGLNIAYKSPQNVNSYKKPTIAGSIYWNRLPIDLRKIESKGLFKVKLKELLINNYQNITL